MQLRQCEKGEASPIHDKEGRLAPRPDSPVLPDLWAVLGGEAMRDDERFVPEGVTFDTYAGRGGAWVKATRCACLTCGADAMTVEIIERVDPDPVEEEGQE